MLVFGAQLADMCHGPAQQLLAGDWYDYINLVGLSAQSMYRAGIGTGVIAA